MPELIRKMPRAGADLPIVDFEDGTPPSAKLSARSEAVTALRALRADGWRGTMSVRINHPRSEWFEGDLDAAVEAGFDAVTLPMVDSADDVAVYHERLRLL